MGGQRVHTHQRRDRVAIQLRGAKELSEKLTEFVGTPNLETIPEDRWEELANRSPEK